MDNISRSGHAKRNIISGLIKQVVVAVMPFIVNTLIIYNLGIQYSGLNGLFSSILQALNLADLGFAVAVTYVLYKPISINDEQKIGEIIGYLKKIYRIVGIVILVAGLCVLPFLKFLIAGDVPSDLNIYILFAIYLSNSVISYLFASYRSTLISAMQREDVISFIYLIVEVVLRGSQILVIVFTKNYYAYIILVPLGSLLANILFYAFSRKLFPNIHPSNNLDPESKKTINSQIRAIFISKLSDTSRNSFDSIVISAFFGLSLVAIYNNYYSIYLGVYTIVLVIVNAVQAGIGNSVASDDENKNLNDLYKFNFISMILVGWCSICMFVLYQPFMIVWMKGDSSLLLSSVDMSLFCLYFYAINMNNARNLYFNSTGLFPKCKHWFILESLGNLILNVLLGYFFGITGILIATIITIFVFNFVCRTNALFKDYFKTSALRFYLQQSTYFIVTAAVACLTYFVCSFINISPWANLFVRLAVCVILPNAAYFLIYFKTGIFKKSYGYLKEVILKRN